MSIKVNIPLYSQIGHEEVALVVGTSIPLQCNIVFCWPLCVIQMLTCEA